MKQHSRHVRFPHSLLSPPKGEGEEVSLREFRANDMETPVHLSINAPYIHQIFVIITLK
jgi:hypothetical protein